jgi:hypothetical protein
MPTWTQRSRIYEINTWVWLYDLSRRYKRPIHLGNVPAQDWDGLGSLDVDAVWLMGVWERSPAGIAISNKNTGLQDEFHRVLPDLARRQCRLALLCVVTS